MLATVAAERREGATAPAEARPEGEDELPDLAERTGWRRTDRWLSLLLLVAVAAVWPYFSPLQ